MDDTFEVRQSRAKAALAVVGCLAFVGLGVWIKDQGSEKMFLAGWASILFFGAMSPLWLSSLINPARLVADASGVALTSTFSRKRWAWSEIEDVVIQQFRSTKTVHLELRRPERDRVVQAALRQSGGPTAALSTGWAMSPDALAARLAEMKARFGSGAA